MVGQVITPSPLKTIGKVKYIKTQKFGFFFFKKSLVMLVKIFSEEPFASHIVPRSTLMLYILSNRVRDLLASYCMMEQKYFS